MAAMNSESRAVSRRLGDTIQEPSGISGDVRASNGAPEIGEGQHGPLTGFTNEEREAVLKSGIWSQSLEGIEVSYELASQLLDEVLREPLIDIG